MESSENNKELKNRSRRSKKLKNLEQEVELILSQEESDDDVFVEKGLNEPVTNINTPRSSQTVLADILQTPRRSCRKSIKPTQDYDDIVSKSCSRANRSIKKDLMITDEDLDLENKEGPTPAEPKWTPAKVGRVSQKRTRKARRNTKSKKQNIEKVNEEHEMCLGIEEGIMEDDTEDFGNEDTQIEDNIENTQIEEIVMKKIFKKHLNSPRTPSESFKEFIEIETQINNSDHDEPIQLIQEDSEDLKELSSEKTSDVSIHLIKDDSEDAKELPSENTNSRNIENECIPGKPSISCKEFMEIGKQINNSHHDEPIQLIQEDSEDLKELSSEETNDVSIHLIQDDSEDAKELPSEKTNFRKIENEENTNKSVKSEKIEDSFGSYLKSNEINISDLGLNPLKEDPDLDDEKQKVKEIDTIVATNETEEMPSLIVCDDDEDEVTKEAKKLNETFDANDSVAIIEEKLKSCEKSPQDVMEILEMSDADIGDTPKKAPRIMLTTTDLQDETLLTTPNLPSTSKHSTNSRLPSTPKQSALAFRFPTPYKNNHNFIFDKKKYENDPPKNISNCSWMSSVTSLEPKDIVLRGIRKRSLSVCIDANFDKFQKPFAGSMAKDRPVRIVSFYSPANQTTNIDDLDTHIARSLKKQKNIDSSNKFVTTRRKRSMSVDDSLISTSMLLSRLPVPIQNPSSKLQTLTTSSSKPLIRTKLPNFAAIHNKNFQKMENLLDHVNRKQDRSKNLINSNIKIRPASAQKNISLIKLGNNNKIEKPKALKKIDLGVSFNANTTLTSNVSFSKTAMASHTSRTINDTMKSQEILAKTRNLPDAHAGKVLKTAITPQKNPQSHHNQKAPKAPQQQARKYLKPTQAVNTTINRNPAASTSTVVQQKTNTNLSTSIIKLNSKVSSNENHNKINTMSNDDKMANRLQRHMDLFKGRAPRTEVASRRNDAVIRGVRSNRRFELQMQHRKNMEN